MKVLREYSPQARHHFTQADQVNQLGHFDANLLPVHFGEDVRGVVLPIFVVQIFLDLTDWY